MARAPIEKGEIMRCRARGRVFSRIKLEPLLLQLLSNAPPTATLQESRYILPLPADCCPPPSTTPSHLTYENTSPPPPIEHCLFCCSRSRFPSPPLVMLHSLSTAKPCRSMSEHSLLPPFNPPLFILPRFPGSHFPEPSPKTST